MPKKGENISLTSYDDLFETDESRAESQLERVQNIPVRELVPFKNHPFKVLDDEAMLRTTESIAEYGVLTPLIARPLDHGGYEIISGHRRAHAAELAGLSEVPVLVRDMDDDAATVLMVDSNLQRENILPSERAFAYRMKLEALNHQGQRSDLTSVQVEQKSNARSILAKETGSSEATIFRFIRLTNLVPDLLDLVDCKQISFNPAVELSYLSPEEQETFLQAMDEDSGQTLTVTEYIDGTQKRSYTATSGQTYSFNITAAEWVKLLNGSHTLKIVAADNYGGSATRTYTFTKNETEIELTLATPLTADDMVTKGIMSVVRQIPAGAKFTVEVCNNGNDASPTWEDVTQNVVSGSKFFLSNTTKTASAWGYNFRIKVKRGTATGDCFITSAGGNFE